MIGKNYEEAAEALRSAVPPEHQQFIASLRLSLPLGRYFLCHAGVRPGIPLERQSEELPFRLVVPPARGFLNTTFTETPGSVAREGEPRALIHEQDAARLGVSDGSLVRLKTEHQLYSQKSNAVTLLTPTVFRTEVTLPAEAAIGNYDVDIKVFADKQIIARGASAFEIIKVGFEQFVATAAQDYGLLYGLTTAMMAIMTGWFAAVVFRRD